MPHGITQCYPPPGRGDIPALSGVVGAGQRRRQLALEMLGASMFGLHLWRADLTFIHN